MHPTENVAKKLIQSVMFRANPKQRITEYHSSYFEAWWWLHHVMGMLVIGKDYGILFWIKRNGIELSTGKILEENLVQSAFHQTMGE